MIPLKHYSPQQIADTIKASIIGQDKPAQTVATALSAHITRCMHNIEHPDEPIRKDNLLIAGPTGTGKTETIRAVINKLNLPIPLTIVSCTALTNTGYTGKSISDVFFDLMLDADRLFKLNPDAYINRADVPVQPERRTIGFMSEVIKPKTRKYDKDLTRKVLKEMCRSGIIILDEFDKLRYSEQNPHEKVYSRKLQSELLKIVEGGSGFSDDPDIDIDTSDILFIGMGAFSGMEAVQQGQPPTIDEIKDYGFMEELVGRFPLRCCYNKLSVRNLYKILTDSDVSPVGDFQRMFSETRNSLHFDKLALLAIAKRAYESQGGARGLRTILSDILYPILFDIDGKYRFYNVRITKDTVANGKPVLTENPDSRDAHLQKIIKKCQPYVKAKMTQGWLKL